jgi:predicted Fe-Mo cluster-binding NifX family protein
MRIAISIWDDKISPVLDTASKLLIIDNDNQKESCRFEANLFEQDIYQRCSFIRKLDLDVLICGAVSRQFSEMLKANGVKIISGISGPAEDVLDAYLKGALLHSGFFMPGSKRDNLDQGNQPKFFGNSKNTTQIKGGKAGGSDRGLH